MKTRESSALSNRNKIKNESKFFRDLALFAILVVIFLTFPPLCMGHDDMEVNPAYKWSREANENFDTSNVKGSQLHHHHHHHADELGHNEGHQHDKNEENHSHGSDPHHHIHTDHHHQHTSSKTDKEKDINNIWFHAIASTILISAAPFFILYAIKLDNTEAMKPRLKILLAFASGGLLGDAFLHLIPHATVPHSHAESGHSHGHDHSHESHNHEHSHDMSIGLWVLGGIIAFLAVEKFVRLIKGDGGHGHSHGKIEKTSVKKNEGKNKVSKEKVKKETVAVAGYLNLVADFAHNFTDGLAIGASYLAGSSIGIVTTITILLHEVPHEIGDYAILIKSGCSRKKAMLLQLVTALGALAGTTLALLGAGGSDIAASWILPFTAGGFIYIATVSVLPELLEESTKLGQSLKEISALLAGVGLMVIIANFE